MVTNNIDKIFDSDSEDNNVEEENSSTRVKSPNTENENMEGSLKKIMKTKNYQFLNIGEVNKLNKYVRENLFRRMKIVNDKFTHSLVLQCLDHLEIHEDAKRSTKFRNILDFISTTINTRRNYLKHQIVKVMQSKCINIYT